MWLTTILQTDSDRNVVVNHIITDNLYWNCMVNKCILHYYNDEVIVLRVYLISWVPYTEQSSIWGATSSSYILSVSRYFIQKGSIDDLVIQDYLSRRSSSFILALLYLWTWHTNEWYTFHLAASIDVMAYGFI